MQMPCRSCRNDGHNARTCPHEDATAQELARLGQQRARACGGAAPPSRPAAPRLERGRPANRGPDLAGQDKCPRDYKRRRGDRLRHALPSPGWQAPVAGQPVWGQVPVALRTLLSNEQVADVMVGELFRKNALAVVHHAQSVTSSTLGSARQCFHAFFTPAVAGPLLKTMNAHLLKAKKAPATLEELNVWMAIFMLRCVNHQRTEWVFNRYEEVGMDSCLVSPVRFDDMRRALRLLPPHKTNPSPTVRAALTH